MQNTTTEHFTVSEVAARAQITVRTLHHYDEIGLLIPSNRNDAGYRLYSESDLERLYEIMLYKQLGLPLEAIREMTDNPAIDRMPALRAQLELLVEKRNGMDAIICAIEKAIRSHERGKKMSSDEMFEGFDAFANAPEGIREEQATYQDEVKERWSDTDAYKESMRRSKRYSKAEWKKIKAEGEATESRMEELLAKGADAEGPEAMAGAEAMREHISRWFYPCDYQMHSLLADMYEADPRFTAHYENRAEGLASFVASAIRANAARGA